MEVKPPKPPKKPRLATPRPTMAPRRLTYDQHDGPKRDTEIAIKELIAMIGK